MTAVRKYSMLKQSVDLEFVPEGHRGQLSCSWQNVSWASRSISDVCPPPDLGASVLDAERDRQRSCPLRGWKPTSVSGGHRRSWGHLGDHQRGVSGPSECSRDTEHSPLRCECSLSIISACAVAFQASFSRALTGISSPAIRFIWTMCLSESF